MWRPDLARIELDDAERALLSEDREGECRVKAGGRGDLAAPVAALLRHVLDPGGLTELPGAAGERVTPAEAGAAAQPDEAGGLDALLLPDVHEVERVAVDLPQHAELPA